MKLFEMFHISLIIKYFSIKKHLFYEFLIFLCLFNVYSFDYSSKFSTSSVSQALFTFTPGKVPVSASFNPCCESQRIVRGNS